MHDALQSFPRALPVYFQWHELIGYSEGAVRLRLRVGRLTLVDISTGCCGFHWVVSERCLWLETGGARAAFAVARRI